MWHIVLKDEKDVFEALENFQKLKENPKTLFPLSTPSIVKHVLLVGHYLQRPEKCMSLQNYDMPLGGVLQGVLLQVHHQLEFLGVWPWEKDQTWAFDNRREGRVFAKH